MLLILEHTLLYYTVMIYYYIIVILLKRLGIITNINSHNYNKHYNTYIYANIGFIFGDRYYRIKLFHVGIPIQSSNYHL